jgi:putative ABC transport system permease protein
MNFWQRLRRRRSLEADLTSELSFHRDMRSQDENAPGFGNETLIREEMREFWTIRWIESTLGDLTFAARGLRKNSAFAIAVIASLTIGIAAVIAIFTAADDLVFRPLPFKDPGSLIALWETNKVAPDATRSPVSPDNFLDWKSRNSVFEDMAYIDSGRSVFSDSTCSEELHVQRVPPNFFKVLGVQPQLGYLPSDTSSRAAADSEAQVAISFRLWRSWFGRDPNVVGQRVQLDGFPRAVTAVMPPGFSFGDREVDLWPYMTIYSSGPHDRGARNMQAVARLKSGITIGQAQAQMTVISKQLAREDPHFNQNWTVTLDGLRDAFSRKVKTSLLLLLGAVSLLMLVACSNAANLLLARYSARRYEIAMRVALGASRWRLTTQLLTESFLIVACSGIAGVVLGRCALAGLVAIAPQVLTQTADVSIDWRILVFAVGLSIATGVVFGLAPSIIGSKADLAGHTKSGTARHVMSYRSPRPWLIAAEIAISVVLLSGGSLLFHSLIRLQDVDPGLRPANVLTFHFRVMSPHDSIRFTQAVSIIESLPGVRSVSATSFLPFDGTAPVLPFSIDGHPASKPGEELSAAVRTVMPRYFETLGIPTLQGRDFTATDNVPRAPMRFVVNEAFAKKYLTGEDALSKRIVVSMARANSPGQIVGVVGDVREGSLSSAAVPTVYCIYSHMPYGQMTLLVRTQRDPAAITVSVRRLMHSLDPKLAVADIRPMEEILAETYSRERFLAVLTTGFSICAVLLAAVGIYGLLTYSVSLRTPEIGIRQAVGAHRTDIVTMVLRDGAWFIIAGLAAGVATALGVTRLMSGLLYQTSASEPVSFGFALATLAIVGLVAAYIPARRASRLDPMRALRVD